MNFEDAVSLVRKALESPRDLSGMEAINLGVAQAMLACEYLKVQDRIMPS